MSPQKIFILMDCSAANRSRFLKGVPVGVFATMQEAVLDADMREYKTEDDHYIVEMELGVGVAPDTPEWHTIQGARRISWATADAEPNAG